MPNAKCILLVEDSSDDVFFFRRAARKAGIQDEIHVAPDGAKAVDFFAAGGICPSGGEHPPRLVFLDLKMPHMNGFDVLEWMRNNPKYAGVPIVVLTSSDHPSDQEKAARLGARLYLTKPITKEQLHDAITRFGI